MKIVEKATVYYELTLSEDEMVWLKNLLQNRPEGGEALVESQRRSDFFNAIRDKLDGK